MREYSSDWNDERLIEWDGNFTSEGSLFLICSEREVDVEEYRRVLERCIEYRNRVRELLSPNP